MKIVSVPVAAGGTGRGKNLWHACEVDARGVLRRVLCKRVTLANLLEDRVLYDAKPVTCPECVRSMSKQRNPKRRTTRRRVARRRRNPLRLQAGAERYKLVACRTGHPDLVWDGRKFTSKPRTRPRTFVSKEEARWFARLLQRAYSRALRGWDLYAR
jgi:hypothetical protein